MFIAGSGALAAISGCSGELPLPATNVESDGGAAEPCHGSATRPCGHTVGAHGEVLSCYEGTQRCEGGHWSVCSDGKIENYKNPAVAPGPSTQSLSTPVACQNDPCDPSCRVFNETPDGGWSSTGSGKPLYTWTGGILSQYPSGLVKKGSKEPCQGAADCQFNQYCSGVSTGLSCAHDKCATGGALLSGCDSCVAQICAADSSCCGNSTCAHDVCTAGVKLDSGCTSCAGQVCAVHPECCTTTWNDQCVTYAQSICNTCKCGAGETFNGGHCYIVASTAKRFSKARPDCTSRGLSWDLAEVGTAAEDTFLKGLVGSGGDGWIGINDQSDTGNWIWANGDPATYTNWSSEPDDGHGTGEDCAWLDGLTGLWSDDACGSSRRYLCEGPVAASALSCGSSQTLYNGKCYRTRTTAGSWSSGVTSCQSLGTGWDLVEIDDAAENTFVDTLTSGGSQYWIGANDQSPTPGEGNFTWSGGAAVSYTNWNGEPNGGTSQNCALLAAANGSWSDQSCSDSHYAVCEGPVITTCPSGWIQAGSKCLQASTTTAKWANAEAACAAQGGHLASAATAADSATLLGLTSGGNLYWMGYTDSAVEGTWAWTDGTTPAYSNWGGEPNGGSSQNCAMVSTADAGWSDEACSDKNATVCEGPQSTTCPSGWSIVGTRCVKAYTTADTWTNAEAFCIAQGGHLASLASSSENATVIGLTGTGLAWLGYSDSATEGTFVAKDGTALSYTNWGSEPDGTTSSCAAVTQSSGNWYDDSCGNSKNYACEGPVTNACPSGWTTSGSKCFQAFSTSTDFTTAEANCVALGGHLATVASAGEQTTVSGLLGGSSQYWIGYTDAAVEGTWVWKDGTSSAYTNWIPSQPDGSGTNCATFSTDGFWYDDGCNTTQKSACEKADTTNCAAQGGFTSGGHCYKFFTNNKKFDDAEAQCVAINAGSAWHLMTINDATENALALTSFSGNKGWIGFSNSSGSWAWKNGTSSYTHWYVYPDGGTSANCADMSASNGRWDDDACGTSHRYVCQMAVPACPSGTVLHNGECYQFATSKSWTNAQTACRAIATGYDLVTVNDSTENAYVKSQITADSWIGFRDAVVGTWTWASGTSTYTNWLTQPDGGSAQNCVAVDHASGKWSDEVCSGSEPFVCEVTPLVCATGTTLHNGGCYKFDGTTRSWANSRAACQGIGTSYDLVTINDATENAWLVSQSGGDFWSGATDVATEGTWAWASGTSAYTNWRVGADGGTSENCATLSNATGLWDDNSCGSSYRYICETTIPGCPVGTSLQGGSCYAFTSSTQKFSNAQATCQAFGAGFDLATVSDAAENSWIASQVPGDAWIGYTDAAAEGNWVWDQGTSAYKNWGAQPNGGTTENCVSFDDATGTWSDSACSTSQKPVCEGPASVSASAGCGAGEVMKNGKCYYYGTTGKTWSAAETACESRGAGWSLVTVSDQTEATFIKTTIGSTRNVWIGYTDSAVEGTFKWVNDDGTTFTAWQSEPNDDPTQECGRILGSDGTWTSEDCATSRKAVCEGPATVGSSAGTWTQSCVDKVASVCNATCGGGSTAGVCTPWLPGQKESNCATGIDLAIGPACEGEQVPVCNHGGIDAPAGVTLAWFPANSNQYPKCNPDLAKRKDTGNCVVNQPIPAGKCVTITCAGMTNNAEILVNPPDATQITECSCQDNWSLYDKAAACGAPDCSGGVSQASLRKVNMYVIVDRSSSMSSGGKWDGARAALKDFFSSPQSAGIGVALEFFPLSAGVAGDASGDGCGMDTGTCAPSHCGNPYVPLGTLTADPAPTDAQEAALVAPLNQVNWLQNSTPSWPALVGAIDWATAQQQTVPNEEHIVVFVTDGQPYGSCINGTAQNTNDQLAIYAGNAYANSGVRTYTIGMVGANNVALDKIADAGGTSQAFVVDGTDPTQVASQLSSALQAIAGQNVSCDFALPNQGLFDPNNATVTYTSGAGTTTTLDRQANAAACGTGWYYDDPNNPTTATLCPDSCTTAKQDTNARVEIHLGCPSYKGNGVFRQTYEAKCTIDQAAQWGFVAWDATQPPNTSIKFKIRAADTLAGLASATFVDIGSVPTDPAVCPISGPAPCPKDLYAALGVPQAHYPYLELEVDTTAYQTSAPTVNDFKVTYSCTDNQ